MQNISTSAVKITIRPKDTTVPVLCDIRRTSIYGLGTIEVQKLDNTQITSRVSLDDVLYSDSQEEHWMKIRQQNPATNLWALCEVHTFVSKNGARTSVWVNWLEYNVSYPVPQ